MWATAMYVGKRPYDRKQSTNQETGEVIPAKKGMQYLFYCADWTKDREEIGGLGRTRFETVDEKDVPDYEAGLPKVGGFCTVSVRESFGKDNNSLCTFEEADE